MEPQRNRESFLTTQYLAYLGNKRALMPFLDGIFRELMPEPEGKCFGDLFAGAGAVSRLALTLGCKVHANDWEDYSVCVNRAWLTCRPGDIDAEFQRMRCLLNGFHPVFDGTEDSTWQPGICSFTPYLSQHFAPRKTETANYRSERLFYTQENALFLDRVRCWLDHELPATQADSSAWGNSSPRKDRVLLLGAVLFVAARQANTNGVFKSFHRGFGGHGRNALDRIMEPMVLPVPLLWPSVQDVEVTGLDARLACSGHSYDLAYLDPPYNIHQYGSNYFLLNSLCRWDRPAVNDARDAEGKLVFRAGIREDWIRTRSPWCLSKGARPALRSLLDALDARHVVLSYNADGIIGSEEMMDILAEYGQVAIRVQPYTSFRGGRQGLSRRMSTAEYAFILTRGPECGRSLIMPAAIPVSDEQDLSLFLLKSRLRVLLGATHHPDRLAKGLGPTLDPLPPAWMGLRFDRSTQSEKPAGALESWIEGLDGCRLRLAVAQLENSQCHSWTEELEVWIDLGLKQAMILKPREWRFVQRRLLYCLSKIAYFKYRDEFEKWAKRIDALVGLNAEKHAPLASGLAGLRARLEVRVGHHLARRTKKDRDAAISSN